MNTIIVPIHIHDIPKLNLFLNTFERVKSELGRGYHWYLDANGCSSEVNDRLKTVLFDYPQVFLHITEQGGRHKALNRGLQFAREISSEVCVFMNDDVVPMPGTIESLSASIQGGEMLVGALSVPREPDFNSPRRVLNSASIHGELSFFERSFATRGAHFRGDCFAMHPHFIEYFPNIHSDDSYLFLRYMYETGERARVLEQAVVHREQEWKVEQAIDRIIRYLQGRVQLKNYCRDIEPDLYPLCSKLFQVPDLEHVKGLFEESRSEIRRGLSEELRGNTHKFDKDPHLRQQFGEYADIMMLYLALRGYEEGRQVLIEHGNTMWRR